MQGYTEPLELTSGEHLLISMVLAHAAAEAGSFDANIPILKVSARYLPSAKMPGRRGNRNVADSIQRQRNQPLPQSKLEVGFPDIEPNLMSVTYFVRNWKYAYLTFVQGLNVLAKPGPATQLAKRYASLF